MDNQEYFDQMLGLAQYNNTWSAKQAEEQMKFQERLSNTAHQREVADLKAAGLNPVLSAGGSGSSVPSGAMGSTDMSTVGALSNIVGQLINQSTALQVAQTQAQANITSSSIMANAQQYAADRAYEAQMNYPNSWAGIVSRLLKETGLRDTFTSIFNFNRADMFDAIEQMFHWVTGGWSSGGQSDASGQSMLSAIWSRVSNYGSAKLSQFRSFVNSLVDSYGQPRRRQAGSTGR